MSVGLFLGIKVTNGVSSFDGSFGFDGAGGMEQRLCQGGFTGGTMADQRNGSD